MTKKLCVFLLYICAIATLCGGCARPSPTQQDTNAFLDAISDCSLTTVRQYLGRYANSELLTATDPEGNAALAIATEQFMLRSLGRDGPDTEESYSIVKLLIDSGANVNAKGADGATALHRACSLGGSTRVAMLLLKRGADIDAQNTSGRTSLHCATWSQSHTKLLISAGATIDIQDQSGETPLHRAVLAENDESVVLLLTAGANENAAVPSGITALHAAVSKGNLPICRALLSHDADVNATSSDGVTPLHLAAFNGHAEITALLIIQGADVNARLLGNRSTPWTVAMLHRNRVIANIIAAAGGGR